MNHRAHRGCRENTESLIQDDAADTIFQDFDSEVHQQPKRVLSHFEIRNHLRDMNVLNLLNGLQFHNESAIYKEVEAALSHRLPFVLNRNRMLP